MSAQPYAFPVLCPPPNVKPYLQLLSPIRPNHPPPPPTFPFPPAPSPFSKSRISVSLTLVAFCCCLLPGTLLLCAPATTPDRFLRSTSLRGRGPAERPVRRREARLIDSRTFHCRFLARMKRVMERTIRNQSQPDVHAELVHRGLLLVDDLPPNTATQTTITITAIMPPRLRLNPLLLDPLAPPSTSTPWGSVPLEAVGM